MELRKSLGLPFCGRREPRWGYLAPCPTASWEPWVMGGLTSPRRLFPSTALTAKKTCFRMKHPDGTCTHCPLSSLCSLSRRESLCPLCNHHLNTVYCGEVPPAPWHNSFRLSSQGSSPAFEHFSGLSLGPLQSVWTQYSTCAEYSGMITFPSASNGCLVDAAQDLICLSCCRGTQLIQVRKRMIQEH